MTFDKKLRIVLSVVAVILSLLLTHKNYKRNMALASNRKERWTVIMIRLMCMMMSCCVFVGFLYASIVCVDDYYTDLKHQLWPKIKAEVTDTTSWKKLVYLETDNFLDDSKLVTHYRIEFRYEADGVEYEGVLEEVAGVQYASYTPGKQFEIRYDPDAPEDYTTDLYVSWGAPFFMGGIALLAIGIMAYMCSSVDAFPDRPDRKEGDCT